jgi:hypothetical protein
MNEVLMKKYQKKIESCQIKVKEYKKIIKILIIEVDKLFYIKEVKENLIALIRTII